MAIIDIRELPRVSDSQEATGEAERERVFYVRVDDPNVDPVTLYSDPGLPAINSTHPFVPGLICRRRSCEHAGFGNRLFRLSYRYESIEGGDLPSVEKLTVPNPLDRSAKIEIDFAPFERVAYKDRHGEMPLNSAGDPYTNPLSVPDTRIVISVRKNMTSWPTFLFTYRNKLNAAAIVIRGLEFQARTLRFVPGRIPDFQIENNVLYLPIEFHLEHRIEGWDEERLDAGFNFLGSDGKKHPILIDGVAPSVEQMLDGTGKPLPNPTQENAVYRGPYEVLDEADFSLLPLS